MPRETWSDERLDDLNAKVGRGFERVDAEIRDLRGEMNARFNSLESRMDSRFDSMESRFASLTRIVIAAMATMIAVVVGLSIAPL